MIRPFTCICMLLTAGSGLYLYQAKHQGLMLDRQIEGVLHQTEETRTRIGVLRAEFALMNDPSRLQDLATEHLPGLGPLQPGQFTTMAELDKRLPSVGASPAPPATPIEPAPAAPLLSATAPEPAAVAASAPSAESAAAAAPVARTHILPAAPVLPAIARATPAEPSGAPVADTAVSPVVAAVTPPPRPHPATPRRRPTTYVARHGTQAPYQPVLAASSAPAWRTTPAPAPAYVAPRPAPPMQTGSLLGMARTMGGAAYMPASAPGAVSQ